jgi:hypothetical protein
MSVDFTCAFTAQSARKLSALRLVRESGILVGAFTLLPNSI